MASGRRQTIQDRLLMDPAKLRVLADPIRSFVVYSLVPEAKTVRQLADELGCPPTRLYYHMQQLQKHALVFVEKQRTVSGIVEKHYRAAARELTLDRQAFTPTGKLDASRREALLGFVFDQSRLEIRRGLEDGRIDIHRRAPAAGALIAYRNVLKLSDEQAARLYRRLYDFWMEYDQIARAPAATGRFYAFMTALYPNDMQPAATAAASAARKRAPRAKVT
jgi:Helix-turn-helix domain